jgi:Ca2+-binding EF-hand superfamily protein/chromosome segregation ATPase
MNDDVEKKMTLLTSTETARDKADAALASATARLEALLPTHSLMEAEIHEVKAKLSNTEIESAAKIEALTDKLKELTKTSSTLQSQLSNEKATNKAHTGKESEALKSIKKAHDKMVAEKDSQLQHASDEAKKLKETAATLKSEAVAKKLHDATSMAKVRRELGDKVVKLEGELKQKEVQVGRIAEFEASLTSQAEVVAKLQTNLRESKAELEKSGETVAELQKKVEKLPELEANLAKITKECEGLEKSNAELKEAVEKGKEERGVLENSNAELKEALEAAAAENAEQKHRMDIAEERTQELGNKLEASADDFSGASRLFAKDEQKLAHVMRELDVAKQTISKLEAENAHLRELLKKRERKAAEAAAGPVEVKKLTKKDIKMMVKHIDHTMGDGDDEISQKEFEKAIRVCRRAKSCAQEHVRGRLLVYKLEQMIDAQGINVIEWYKQCVVIHGSFANEHGEQGITSKDMHTYLSKVHKTLPDLEELKEDEIQDLVHFMDPNMDGHMTKQEVKDAFRRAHMPPNSLYAEYQCGIAMGKLEDYMHEKKARISELFQSMDTDGSGYISMKEFAQGLERLVGLDKSKEDEDMEERLMASKEDLMRRHGAKEEAVKVFSLMREEGGGEGEEEGEGAAEKRSKYKRSQTGF